MQNQAVSTARLGIADRLTRKALTAEQLARKGAFMVAADLDAVLALLGLDRRVDSRRPATLIGCHVA